MTCDDFWEENGKNIRCNEHYMVSQLRKSNGTIDLSFIEKLNGKIVGHIIYSKAYIRQINRKKIKILNLGLISALPELKKRGIGSALMFYSIEEARKQCYGGVLFYSHANYYPRFSFFQAREYLGGKDN